MPCFLGIDCGLASTGVGIITSDGRRHTYVHHSVIQTKAATPMAERLKCIYDELIAVIDTYSPVRACVEKIYFARNVSSAMPVAQARGVVLLSLARKHITIDEISPLMIKKMIIGSGGADKEQIEKMVGLLLGIDTGGMEDHCTDALAMAVCSVHLNGIPGVYS